MKPQLHETGLYKGDFNYGESVRKIGVNAPGKPIKYFWHDTNRYNLTQRVCVFLCGKISILVFCRDWWSFSEHWGKAPSGHHNSVYFLLSFSNILVNLFRSGGPRVGMISIVIMVGVLQCGQMPFRKGSLWRASATGSIINTAN